MKILNCILLVDDNVATNFLHKKIIDKLDVAATIEIAENGEKAITYLQQSLEKDDPDPELILLDINMPRMNGWEFLQEYKKRHFDAQSRIIIMLTNSPNPDDESKAGTMPLVSGFVKKPLTRTTMIGIMERYFEDADRHADNTDPGGFSSNG